MTIANLISFSLVFLAIFLTVRLAQIYTKSLSMPKDKKEPSLPKEYLLLSRCENCGAVHRLGAYYPESHGGMEFVMYVKMTHTQENPAEIKCLKCGTSFSMYLKKVDDIKKELEAIEKFRSENDSSKN